MLAMQASEDRARWTLVANQATAHTPSVRQPIDAAAGTIPPRPDR
jgi:hypothetical protein